MLVITKKKFQIWPTLLIIKMRDQQLMFCVSSRTLLIDVLWRQSMQKKFMDVAIKAMHTANMHKTLLKSLLCDVLMCLNGSEL